jgi:hypothetical protein
MVPPYSDRISRVPPYFSLAQYHKSLFAYGTITRYGRPFQAVLLRVLLSLTGFSDFARHYFRNLGWCIFLELLRCFSSPGSPRMTMYSSCDTPKGGFPHSEISGSKLICQLPEAYRRLSRLSSPIIAKASTMCSYSLDPITLISQSIFKEWFVRSFTWRVIPYLYLSSNLYDLARTSRRNQKFILTQSKFLKTMLLMARSALNLYECAVSISNLI